MKEQNVDRKNKVKKGHYKAYIPSIGVLGLSVVVLCVTVVLNILLHNDKIDINVNNIQLVLGVVSGISLIMILVAIFSMIDINKTNKYLNSPAYGLNYEKEKECYKNVGLYRKKLKYGAVSYKKYSEWKAHVLKDFDILIGKEDFYRFLMQSLRKKNLIKECILTLVLPIEITFVPMFLSGGDDLNATEIVACLILMLFMVIFFTVELINVQDDINFLTDLCEIVRPRKENERDDD